jgi:hypothetical protein
LLKHDSWKNYEGEQLDEKSVKVAIIQLAFQNAKLIQLLQKRGDKITAGNFKGVAEVEEDINVLKAEKFDDLTKPSIAFITFEESTGYNLAC